MNLKKVRMMVFPLVLLCLLAGLVFYWVKDTAGLRHSRAVVSVMTTCSGVNKNGIPVDAANCFRQNSTRFVYFTLIFVVTPSGAEKADLECIWTDPDDQKIAEMKETFNLSGRTETLNFNTWIGLKEIVADNGQMSLPQKPGAYFVHTFIYGKHIGSTPFFIKG